MTGIWILQRKVILHHHLFKNAGTFIDLTLKDLFGETWRLYNLPNNFSGKIAVKEMRELILSKSNIIIIAWPFHQAVPPLPKVKGVYTMLYCVS